jgi:hypothetical protein
VKDIVILGGPNGAVLGAHRGGHSMKELTPDEWHDAVRKALDEVDRKLASGELDQSGPYYSDEELRAMAASNGAPKKPEKKSQGPAA